MQINPIKNNYAGYEQERGMDNKGFYLVDIPVSQDDRGSLSVVEFQKLVEFDIKRSYWLYNTDETISRGVHAHKNLKQLLVALRGEVTVVLDDGKTKNTIKLVSPTTGLVITKPLWRELKDFKGDPIVMVFASEIYNESDYIRNYEDFLKYVR